VVLLDISAGLITESTKLFYCKRSPNDKYDKSENYYRFALLPQWFLQICTGIRFSDKKWVKSARAR